MSDLLNKGIENYCRVADEFNFSNETIINDSQAVMGSISKLGEVFIRHYLVGIGENLIIPTDGIIENDLTVKINIKTNLIKYIKSNSIENIPNGQNMYNNRNFKLAFGSLNFQWKIVNTFNAETSQSYIVDIWFVNKYRWHETVARISQCMHRAFSESIGKQYDMIGKRVFYLLDVDSKGTSDMIYLNQNSLKALRHKNMPSAHTGKDVEVLYPQTASFFKINQQEMQPEFLLRETL